MATIEAVRPHTHARTSPFRNVAATDFSRSASLKGAREINLTGQGMYDPFAGTTHLGILNSPDTRKATFEFLNERLHPRSH